VTAGLAEAVPAGCTLADPLPLGSGDPDDVKLLELLVAQPAKTRSTTAQTDDPSLGFMSF